MRPVLRLVRPGLLSLGLAALLAACSGGDDAAKTAGGGAGKAGGGRRGAGEPQPVETTSIKRRDLRDTLNLIGSLAANESAEVRPEIAGQIKGIYFDEGQRVKAGDLLARIDDAELRAQLAQAEARFELAQLSLERSENLAQSRTIPQSEADRARSEFASSKAELSLLRVRLERTEIRAPFDGVVGARTISPGDYVTTATVVTRIDDLSRLKVEFNVPERFLAHVGPGTGFSINARNLATGEALEPVSGEVYFVSAVIERATRASAVKGYVLQPPAQLRPGMFASIELVLQSRTGVLTVPEGAILATARGTQIITVAEKDGAKVARFIPVRLGLRAHGFVEVEPLDGVLSENTSVVASGVGGLVLFEGAPLEPRPLNEAFQLGS